MKMRHVLGAGVALSVLALSSTSNAFDDSTRGPFYVQGTFPLGIHFGISLDPSSNFGGWRPDVEFGYHFSGRHDGFVLGFRQAFIATIAPQTGAGTAGLRYGYDIPVHVGAFELTIAPYGTIGIGYTFDGPYGAFNMTWGADGKFFIVDGFYAFARPFEMGFMCFPDLGGKCGIQMV